MKEPIFTKTMAQLYEAQEMFWEAYIIYKKIYSKEPSEELRKKIIELGEKLIDESSYSQITLRIFSKKELAEFSILSENQYKNYLNTANEMIKSEEFESLLNAYQENNEPDGEIKNYSGEEIYEIIQSNFGGKKPEEIKLADIYEIIKRK